MTGDTTHTGSSAAPTAGHGPVERGVMQHARLLADVLRAEAAGQDLQEGPHGVHVCAMRQDRTLYELGSVSEALVYQNPQKARAAIERIKFARRD